MNSVDISKMAKFSEAGVRQSPVNLIFALQIPAAINRR